MLNFPELRAELPFADGTCLFGQAQRAPLTLRAQVPLSGTRHLCCASKTSGRLRRYTGAPPARTCWRRRHPQTLTCTSSTWASARRTLQPPPWLAIPRCACVTYTRAAAVLSECQLGAGRAARRRRTQRCWCVSRASLHRVSAVVSRCTNAPPAPRRPVRLCVFQPRQPQHACVWLRGEGACLLATRACERSAWADAMRDAGSCCCGTRAARTDPEQSWLPRAPVASCSRSSSLQTTRYAVASTYSGLSLTGSWAGGVCCRRGWRHPVLGPARRTAYVGVLCSQPGALSRRHATALPDAGAYRSHTRCYTRSA